MACILGGVFLGAFLVYSLYRPVIDFVFQQKNPAVSSTSSSSQSSRPESSSAEKEPVYPKLTPLERSRAVPLSPDIAGDPDSLRSYLDRIKKEGYTAVVFEAKDQEGQLHYRTRSGIAASAEAVAADAVDLSAVFTLCREKGIALYAMLYAFEDHYAGLADASMAIRYENADGVYWLDDYPEAGGKTWLNPCSETAQVYLRSLMEELLELGASAVIWDGVYFPTVAGSSSAYYGSSQEQSEVLRDFLRSLSAAAEDMDAAMVLRVPADAAVGENTAPYGGKNPLSFGVTTLLDLRLSQLRPFLLNGTHIPSAVPAESLTLLLETLGEAETIGPRLALLDPQDAAEQQELLRAQKVNGLFLPELPE